MNFPAKWSCTLMISVVLNDSLFFPACWNESEICLPMPWEHYQRIYMHINTGAEDVRSPKWVPDEHFRQLYRSPGVRDARKLCAPLCTLQRMFYFCTKDLCTVHVVYLKNLIYAVFFDPLWIIQPWRLSYPQHWCWDILKAEQCVSLCLGMLVIGRNHRRQSWDKNGHQLASPSTPFRRSAIERARGCRHISSLYHCDLFRTTPGWNQQLRKRWSYPENK